MADYTQRQLEEMVVGKNPNPRAVFFEQAVLNTARSKEAGRRLYDRMIYIRLSQPGVTDSISYQAQKQDLIDYADEYQYFLNNKQGIRKPGIDIIPNLDITHLQELRDYGILTIPQLADMEVVPPHLAYAHDAAKVFNQALKETSHVEEESIEEDRQESRKAETLLTPDRPEHGHDDGRYDIPRSVRPEQVPRDSKGHGQGGQEQRNNPVGFVSDNWSITM